MHKFWLVFKHVYQKNVRSGSWLMMVVSPVLLILITTFITKSIIESNAPSNTEIAIVADTKIPLKSDSIKYKQMTKDEADKKLKAEDIDGILTITTEPEVSGKLVANTDDPDFTQELTQTLSALKIQLTAQKLKLSADQVQNLITPAKVETKLVKIEDGKIVKDESNTGLNIGLSGAITIIIMMVTVIYGSMVAQEIATEKGTRIMESLLSAVNAKTQFYGKIMAIMALLGTQVLIYALAIGISWPILSTTDGIGEFLKSFDFSALIGAKPIMFLMFLIIGTFTYSVLAALCGSLVASIEQVQTAVMPVTMFSMAAYVLSFVAIGSDSLLIKIFSYVPFLNISIMPVRIAQDSATIMEGLISLLISLVFVVAFTMLVARAYRSNVLVYSESGLLKGFKRSLQIMKAEK